MAEMIRTRVIFLLLLLIVMGMDGEARVVFVIIRTVMLMIMVMMLMMKMILGRRKKRSYITVHQHKSVRRDHCFRLPWQVPEQGQYLRMR